jgi:rhamnose transport system permease protein
MNRMRREIVLAFLILGGGLAVGYRSPAFLTTGSLMDVGTDVSVLVIMALAQMLVILTRGIDLSVAANLAFSGMIVALINHAAPGLPIPLLILTALMVGLGLGLINGAMIALAGIPPIVVTLATLSIYRGMVFVVSGGRWISSHEMSPAFQAFPNGRLLGLTHLIWFAAAAILLFWAFLRFTVAGRQIVAYGSNPKAALYVGISRRRVQLLVYSVSGAVAGVCGYLWVARYAIAFTEVAIGFELQVIAACVIGGVSIAGGVGSVAGCALGALFLGLIANALPVIDISPFWQMLISGAAILAAVIINTRAQRPAGKIILRPGRAALLASGNSAGAPS